MKNYRAGIYSKLHNIINRISIVFFVIVGIIFGGILVITDWNKLISLAIFAIIVFLGMILVLLLNPATLAIKEFNKKADLNKFITKIDKMLKDERLHPDTYNFLLSQKANALALKDKKESIKIMEKTKAPSFPAFSDAYSLVYITYLINKGEKDKALGLINKLQNKKNYLTLYRAYQIYLTEDLIDNIEDLLVINSKLQLVNIINLKNLCYYFETRKDLEKAKKYAIALLSISNQYTETYEYALKLTKGE